MKKVKITFPQITFGEKIIELSDEAHEKIVHQSGDEEKAEFIIENLNQDELDWMGNTKDLESAIDVGYCGVVNER